MSKLIPKLQREATGQSERLRGKKDTKRGQAARERRKETVPLTKRLSDLLTEFSKDKRLEYIDTNITTLDKDYKFFKQRTLSNIWKKYEEGKLNPNMFAVLNDEYNGAKGIDLLKELAKKLNFSTSYLKDIKMPRAEEYSRMKLKNEIDKLTEITDDDANIDTTRQLFSDKKYPLTKVEDIADKLEERMYELDEGEDTVYSYEDEEIDEDILNTEMSKLVRFYSLLYYVADLRGKSLNSKMLNWEGHEVEADSLPEKFPIITDTYNALQEEE